MKKSIAVLIAATALSWCPLGAAPLPRLADAGAIKQLHVDGKPFLMLAGELHNSSASSEAYMAPIWPKLKAMHLNTVVSTVSWDMVEPKEGTFDFRSLDSQVAAARANGLRLVMIWFGAFKNARSTYAPGWIRADQARFPRALIHPTKPQRFTYPGAMPNPVLSPFSVELQRAEQKAFLALTRHLKQSDPDHTVIMLQVDNEIGLLSDSRDRSALAQRQWDAPVPAELMAYLARHRAALRPELAAVWGRQQYRSQGTWAEVFGTDWQAEEVFMAWGYGRFINAVVKEAAQELPLPLYVNAWLGPQPGQPEAGDYPSGGPVPRVADVWKAAAPTLAFLAPDIYIDDFKGTLASFDRPDNPIFVPEARFQTGNAFWAIGRHKALGFSVFGIEDGFSGNQLAQAYQLLGSMSGLITAAKRTIGCGPCYSKARCRSLSISPDTPSRYAVPPRPPRGCCSMPAFRFSQKARPPLRKRSTPRMALRFPIPARSGCCWRGNLESSFWPGTTSRRIFPEGTSWRKSISSKRANSSEETGLPDAG